jgi:hypothetical protein
VAQEDLLELEQTVRLALVEMAVLLPHHLFLEHQLIMLVVVEAVVTMVLD